MSTIRQRVVAALGANAFGQAVGVIIQLASLPLFLYKWEPATYGIWLMLSALPAYLAMADIGMVAAAGNRMTMAMGSGDVTMANTVFHSAGVFVYSVCGAIGLIVVPAVLWLPIPGVTDADERGALALLACGVLVVLVCGLADAMFRATGRYALGTLLASLSRLLEFLGAMAGLMLLGTYTAVALGTLAARIVSLVVIVIVSRRDNHSITWGLHAASIAELRTNIGPALSIMVFPMANALSFQGITLLVGQLFGPVALALFNAHRTLARTAVQLTSIFSHALGPEFSRLFGGGGAPAVNRLYRRTVALGIAVALGVSLALYFAAPWLLRWWTHGAIEFRSGLMLLMVVYAAIGGARHVPHVMLIAINQHVALAQWTLISAILSVAVAFGGGAWLGLAGVAMSQLLAELAIALISAHLAGRVFRSVPQRFASTAA